MMSLVEITDRPAVGNVMSFKMPFVAKHLLHKIGVSTAGFLVGTVISTHDSFHISLCHQSFKSGKISFPQILLRSFGIETVTQSLGTGMHRKMFGTGGSSQVTVSFGL